MIKTYSEWVDIVNNLAYDEVLVDMLSDWRADGSRLTARIAELEAFIDRLIELGEWGVTGMEIVTSFRGGEMHNLAIEQGDKWDALVKDWKEREE